MQTVTVTPGRASRSAARAPPGGLGTPETPSTQSPGLEGRSPARAWRQVPPGPAGGAVSEIGPVRVDHRVSASGSLPGRTDDSDPRIVTSVTVTRNAGPARKQIHWQYMPRTQDEEGDFLLLLETVCALPAAAA